jgi:hypothetical protein
MMIFVPPHATALTIFEPQHASIIGHVADSGHLNSPMPTVKPPGACWVGGKPFDHMRRK